MNRLRGVSQRPVRARAMLAGGMLICSLVCAPVQAVERYDIVIRNGRVLDGAGNPWIDADIAILNGRFVRVGHVEERGRTEIDAKGRYVTPGFIDAMDQSGEALLNNGLAENKLRMGVTTVVAGEGGTPVPASEIPAYFARLERQGISPNFATFYSATQARMSIIDFAKRKPAAAELERMKEQVAIAMRGGALGVATALIYPPGAFQSTDELVELVKVAGRYNGLYATHMRDEGRFINAAVDEAIEIGKRAGVRVEIFHLKVGYEPLWGKAMKAVGAQIEEARLQGLDIGADVYAYTAGGTGLDATVPPWVFADGLDEAAKRLRDPDIRRRLKEEVEAEPTRDWTNLVQSAGGWDHVVLANPYNAEYDKYRNTNFTEIGRLTGKHPADAAWDILLAALPNRAGAFFFMMSEDDVRTALAFPWVSIGSDASAADSPGLLGDPHPRAYGNFPRVIAEYVRKNPVLTLADAIRKMTSLPAARFGFADRGVIREGLAADVVIFDYDRIADRATYEEPALFPIGIDMVLVNGQIVIDHDRHTGARPGKVLLGPGAR